MKPLQLDDFLQYHYLSALTPSPDRNKCAFVVSHCDIENNGYQSYIYIFDCQSRRIWQLTGLGQEKEVVWLDNDTVLFPACRDPQLAELIEEGEPWTCYYAISLSGGEAKEYMRVPLKVNKILPLDKERFALVADYHIGATNPYDYPPPERKKLLLKMKQYKESYDVADELPFRHDGKGWHNGIRDRLYLYNRQEESLKAISAETQNIEFINVQNKRIIYSAGHFTKDSPKQFLGGICIYDAESQNLREYVDEKTYRMRFCGFIGDSPVFMGSDGIRYGYQENPYFFVIDDQTGQEQLFGHNELSASGAVISDSRYGSGSAIATAGEYIYFVGTKGSHAQLKRIGLDGCCETLTKENGSVDYIAVCDEEIIFIGFRGNRLQELYSLKNGREECLSAFNEWVQEERLLSTPQSIDYENDGVNLEGFVIKPPGLCKGEKYPAILYIHGGHKLCFGSVFYHELQLWASRGYFVIYCNPRGSDGYDNDFADIIGRYGDLDYRDIMVFTDVCLQRFPEIDPARLGVGGGSYGGFMTNWIIGHTDRFRCAVSQRGIASFLSMFGTGDTSYLFPLWQFDTDPWMDNSRYWDYSPLKFGDRVKTPTLFIHSEHDYRCPVSEGIQMYYALKYHGVEARLAVFKEEGHELSRSGKPRNRLNRLQEINDWFDKYLQ
jgi:acylaminoacyl-peptidase